jgi:acetoin utilization protein AcuB
MSTNVEKAHPLELAERAWERMRQSRIRHLVVVEGGRVEGILSDRDLGGARGAAHRKGRTVSELMTPQVLTAGRNTTVRQAANLLRGHVVGCLPIVEGGKLQGIVTVSDLLELLGRGLERPVLKVKRWTLKHRGRRPRPRMTR